MRVKKIEKEMERRGEGGCERVAVIKVLGRRYDDQTSFCFNLLTFREHGDLGMIMS